MSRRARLALVAVVQLAVAAVLAETLLVAMYTYPSRHYPAGLLDFLRWEYSFRRNIVQFDTGRARYDPELLYTLRPGRYTFANVEYATAFAVNSLGVRDDEASLAHPEIIVAGDSYAMGWGVAQDAAFPQVIERRTGRRVLNAAVASYGTVREMRLLDRVDTSRATTLVIQYCANDFEENDAFATNGNRHVPSGEAAWLDAIAQQQRGARYRPFRLVYDAAVWIKRGIEGRKRGGNESPARPPDQAAELFLNALQHAPRRDLTRLQIIVTDPDANPGFIRALDRLHGNRRYPPHIRALRVVDVSAWMTPDVQYVLDDHLTARGHELIADAIIRAIDK